MTEEDRVAATDEGQVQRGWRRVARRYDNILAQIEAFFAVVAAILLFAMIATVSYDVIGRQFFSSPGPWAVELSEYIMLYLTFLLAPWVLRQDGHVRVDILVNRLGLRTRFLFSLVAGFAAAIACLVLFWFSLEVAVESYQRGVMLRKVLQVPQYVLLAIIPLGSLFLFLRFVCQILQEFANRRPIEEEAPDTQAEGGL